MCGLFGMMDCNNSLTVKEKNRILRILAQESEVRGTDASGIAYNNAEQLTVYKRPRAGGKLHIKVSQEAKMIIGHTRMTTQGEAINNYNNHPFKGKVGINSFALAHNGVIYNDLILKATEDLPMTKIETDSYTIVQLLEKQGELSCDALRSLAESLEGIFTLTILDDRDNIYFIKGENPLCLYYYPERNIYLYTSTEEIMQKALKRLDLNLGRVQKIVVKEGEILRIDSRGERTIETFDPLKAYGYYGLNRCYAHGCYSYRDIFGTDDKIRDKREREYIDDLKAVAIYYGYTPEDIDDMLKRGFSGEEIEEMLYLEMSGYIYA